MNPIDALAALFEKFPGIGPRQAGRFVQYLLRQNQSHRAALADAIKKLGAETAQCKKCFRWFAKTRGSTLTNDGVKAGLCSICVDAHRDSSVLFVVEKDADIENAERSGFRGLYFVLGGTIPLASEEPQKYIRQKELVARVSQGGASTEKIREVILGLSATSEGDHTRLIVQEKLKDAGPKISSLGRGLSTGSELEYADPETISQALGNRR